MIAHASTSSHPAWQARFVAMLPAISSQAQVAFRGLDPEKREDAIAEVIANSFAAYARLVELDKESLAYATPLATFAIRQYRDGRRVGSKQCNRDVYARRAQRLGKFRLQHLGSAHSHSDGWREQITDNMRTPIPDQVQFRCDFPAWLETLKSRDRRIALKLADGERTSTVAKLFGVSPGRVSQVRAELCQAWQSFVGDLPANEAAPASACVA
jgi:hypothetical protein